MSRAKNRPPRLEPRVDVSRPAPPPTPEDVTLRSKIAGPAASGPGPTELRRTVDRLARGDRRAWGEITPVAGVTVAEAWVAVTRVLGATADVAQIDAFRTVAAARAAAARVREVASAGGLRIAIATARPASLLTLHLAFAALGRAHGAEVVELADFGPIRADGRTPRWLRWVGSVAVVSDGHSLCDARDGEAAREWLFAIPRPSLVIADGPFAEVALERGIEVIALAGLDRPALAVATARGSRGVVVPLHTDRPPRAYRVIEELIAQSDSGADLEVAADLDGAGSRPLSAGSDAEV